MFEWDADKNTANIKKHGIDFVDAKDIWQNPVLELPSDQNHHSEERFLAIGEIQGRCITVVYTWREGNRRLISARKARKNEREDYYKETR